MYAWSYLKFSHLRSINSESSSNALYSSNMSLSIELICMHFFNSIESNNIIQSLSLFLQYYTSDMLILLVIRSPLLRSTCPNHLKTFRSVFFSLTWLIACVHLHTQSIRFLWYQWYYYSFIQLPLHTHTWTPDIKHHLNCPTGFKSLSHSHVHVLLWPWKLTETTFWIFENYYDLPNFTFITASSCCATSSPPKTKV